MRRLLYLTFFALITIVCFAQNSGILEFMGIPIDGTESQFCTQLKNKGFKYNAFIDAYQGQFNGKPVDIYVHTNHELVDRVYVSFPSTSENNIRNEFNTLLTQFENTGKYLGTGINEKIPNNERISHEINVNNKDYQAVFGYMSPDKLSYSGGLISWDRFAGIIPDSFIENIKEYNSLTENMPDYEKEELWDNMMIELLSTVSEDEKKKITAVFNNAMNEFKSQYDGVVWFTIHEDNGKYRIGLYYDNIHNQAHGEDL